MARGNRHEQARGGHPTCRQMPPKPLLAQAAARRVCACMCNREKQCAAQPLIVPLKCAHQHDADVRTSRASRPGNTRRSCGSGKRTHVAIFFLGKPGGFSPAKFTVWPCFLVSGVCCAVVLLFVVCYAVAQPSYTYTLYLTSTPGE